MHPRRVESDLVGLHLYANNRQWVVTSVYAPIQTLRIPGLRYRLQDEKHFVSFCNQRDFEVLVGIGEPGSWCSWLGDVYVDPTSRSWFGLCWEMFDHQDDLAEWSILLEQEGRLYNGVELERRIHDDGKDYRDLRYLQEGTWLRIETEPENWVACSF